MAPVTKKSRSPHPTSSCFQASALLCLLWRIPFFTISGCRNPSHLSKFSFNAASWGQLLSGPSKVEGFPGGAGGKEPAANEGDKSDMGSIPGWGRSPGGGHGNPLQHSCLENPMERGAWRATVHGVAKSQTRLKQLTHPQAPGERNSFLLSGSQPPLSTALSDPTPVHVTLQGRQASSQNQMEMRPLKFSVPGTVHGLQRGRRTEELQLSCRGCGLWSWEDPGLNLASATTV